MAERVKVVRPDWAALKVSGQDVTLSEGRPTVELGILKSGEKKEARWKVKAPKKEDLDLEVAIYSTRGGVHKMKVKVD